MLKNHPLWVESIHNIGFAKENFTTISGNHGYSKAPGKSNFDSIYKRYSLIYLEV